MTRAHAGLRPAEPDCATLKDAMRRVASSVVIITSRDVTGAPHGMVATSAIPVSMDPPSMLVAVNRDASLHPVVQESRRFRVNLLCEHQGHLLDSFSRSALREERFRTDDWRDAWTADLARLPWLQDSAATIDCRLDLATEYATHTLFIGRVIDVRLPGRTTASASPLLWFDGQRATLATAA